VGPNRIDHVNFITPDPPKTREQLAHIGGLKLSERLVNDGLSWMYGGNRQHHILGLVKGPVGLHHTSFELPDFNCYLKLGDLLDQAGKQLVWGPGRHRPGDNTYAYYLDASGAMIECSGSMALIADDADFVPNVITNLARPGNVREMQNVIERAVILSPSSVLQVPLSDLQSVLAHSPSQDSPPMKLADAEREHILGALEETGWVIGGPKGAALRLGMKRSTLQHKMRKLGIARP